MGKTEENYELKLIKRYVDDVACNVKKNPLLNANSLHKNLESSLKTLIGNGNHITQM